MSTGTLAVVIEQEASRGDMAKYERHDDGVLPALAAPGLDDHDDVVGRGNA